MSASFAHKQLAGRRSIDQYLNSIPGLVQFPLQELGGNVASARNDELVLGRNVIPGTDSTFSGAGNWVRCAYFGLPQVSRG